MKRRPRLHGALARRRRVQRHRDRPPRRRGRPRPARDERGPARDPALHRLRAAARALHNTTADHQYGDLFLRPTGPLHVVPLAVVELHADRRGRRLSPVRVRVAPDAPVGDYELGYQLGDRLLASTPVKVVSDPATQCVPAGRMTATATSSQGTDDASRRSTATRRRSGARRRAPAAVDHDRPRRRLRHQRAALPAALRRCPERPHQRVHAGRQHRRHDVHRRPHQHLGRVGADEDRAAHHARARRPQAPPDGHRRAQQLRRGGGAASRSACRSTCRR